MSFKADTRNLILRN